MGRTQLPLCLLAALVCLLARADAYDLLQFRHGAFSAFQLVPSNVNDDDPSTCPGPAFSTDEIPAGVRDALNCIFTAYNNSRADDIKLWKNLWNTWGKCTDMSVAQFFTFITTAYSQHPLNTILADAGISPGSTVDRNDIFRAIKDVTGYQPFLDCFNLPDGTNAVKWIALCYDPTSLDTPQLIDCPSKWDPNSPLTKEGGPQCAGPLELRDTGVVPPPECSQYFPRLLPGVEATTGTQYSPPPPTTPIDTSSSGGMSAGVIAGAAAGGVVVLGAVVAGIMVWRSRSSRRRLVYSDPEASGHSPAAHPSTLPSTLPPATPELDSFIHVQGSPGGGGGGGAGGGTSAAGSMGPHTPSPYLAGGLAAAAAVGGAAAVAAGARGSGASTPQTASVLPSDYATFDSAAGTNVSGGSSAPAEGASLPPVAIASLGTAGGSQGCASLDLDPLLSYARSQVRSLPESAVSAGSGGGTPVSAPGSARALGAGGSAAMWAIPFTELSIVRPIGEGSFGKVYLAEWHATPVAVKLLIGDTPAVPGGGSGGGLQMSSPLLARMESEAALMLALRHPNCCSILGVCESPPCLVTEYCERGSVTEVLRAGRVTGGWAAAQLTWARRLSMALDCAKGMIYLETRGILHRDLKSPNLLVDSNWRCKISDYGLSKYMGGDSDRSSSMAAMNPRWLAPEIMAGERATQASDVFSFSVILWELLTWELPWADSNPWQLVSLLLGGGRLPLPKPDDEAAARGPDRLPPQAHADYTALIKACWAHNPLDRPAFAEVIERLRRIADQAPQ